MENDMPLQQNDHRETEKLLISHINDVRSVLKDKHGLEIPPESDDFIARCLRMKDGNLDKAVSLVIAFHTTFGDFKNWDATLQPSNYKEFYDSCHIPLIQRDSQGRKIFVYRINMWDPQMLNFDETVVATWMLAEYYNKEFIDGQRNGYVVIVDFNKLTLQQTWGVKPFRLLSLAKMAQNGVNGRIKGVHVVCNLRIAKAIYMIVKPFLKEKLKKRIFFHDSFPCLHQHFDVNGLPNLLGGNLDPQDEECVDKSFLSELNLQDSHFKEIAVNSFPRK